MKKTVFIFGAGASIGLPQQEGLLKTYFRDRRKDDFKSILKTYFEEFFNINFRELEEAKFPTFEEALGIIQIAIEKEEAFRYDYGQKKIMEISDALIVSMGITIENCRISDNIYNKLIRKLFHRGHFTQNEYSFVNLNYDILLDISLMELLRKKIYIDYMIPFTNSCMEFTSKEFPLWAEPGQERVKYLKPHGSFNWMYCPKCNSIYISGDKKGPIFSTGYLHKIGHCAKDECELKFIIEPPTLFKKFKNIYLQIIWKELSDVLIDADRFVFTGYSLPDADIWFKYLLKKSFLGKDKEIIVINPSEREEERYKRLLGDVKYYRIGFSDFVNNIRIYLPKE